MIRNTKVNNRGVLYACVVFKLILRCRHLLNHDPGHLVPPSVSITGTRPYTVPNINCHANDSFVDSLAETSNLSYFVSVGVCSAVVLVNVVNTINGEWSATFHAVEREVLAHTAV